MRANHIPLTTRLRNRVAKLAARLEDPWHNPDGAFYDQCRHCGRDCIGVSMRGHFARCPVPSWEGELTYYQRMLDAELGSR